MRRGLAIACVVGFLGAGGTPGIACAQSALSPAVEEFAESVGAIAFAAGQMVIQARVCGGDEKVGHDIRKLIGERVRQCIATDPRLREIGEQMEAAFDSMLTNAAVTTERRGKDTVCALYRSPDLQVEVATALQMGTQLATDAGRERISRLPCPAKD